MSTPINFHPLGTPQPDSAILDRVADIDPRLTRTHFFDGRLLTAEDLIRDQIYLDQRLREVGRTLGVGVLDGLELSFTDVNGQLRVSNGSSVTESGRVLEINRSLEVTLGDRALISHLNKGKHRKFNRGLYAVVLLYAEMRTDFAEVFPTDLSDKRGSESDVISESVQLGLVPLPQPLAQNSELAVRANLINESVGRFSSAGIIPEDGTALGVLAIAEDRPIWLDSTLLRQPARVHSGADDLQQDLARRYEALYQSVLEHRRSGAVGNEFTASEYFKVLPPAGSAPKDAFNPEAGSQSFFPDHYQISVAPVRISDLEVLRAESMRLPPLNLSSRDALEVLVLAPLNSKDYAFFAGSLERPANESTRLLDSQELLDLRRRPRHPVHTLDTDAAAWRAIWDRITEESVVYIRRPTRAAETALSAIVLAQGTKLPGPPPATPTPTPSNGDALIQSEDAAFLNRVNLDRLGDLRPPSVTAGTSALASLKTQFGTDTDVINNALSLLLLVERRYDGIVWQTLFQLASDDTLAGFLSGLRTEIGNSLGTGAAVANIGPGIGLPTSILDAWAAADVV